MGRAQGHNRAVIADGLFAGVIGTRRGSGRGLTARTDGQVRPYTLKRNPSQAARLLAGQLWPQVQKQRKLAPGVYGFTCAGHGGIIAVIGKADLDPTRVAAAREAGLTELVVEIGNRAYSTVAGVLVAGGAAQSAELWVGEEDCDWATILYDNPKLLASSIAAGYLSEGVSAADVEHTVRNYQENFLAALYTDYKPEAGGQLDRARRRQRLLDAGEYLRSSALGEGSGDEYQVRVTFTNAAGEDREHLMSKETYHAIPLGVVATVDDYRAHGEVVDVVEVVEVAAA